MLQQEEPVRAPVRITRRAAIGILVLLGLTVFAAQSCQQSQVRISKELAIERAQPEADFEPERTQVRLVRQGLTAHPYWAVSFSIRAPEGDDYARITTVRVDANSGEIAAVNRER